MKLLSLLLRKVRRILFVPDPEKMVPMRSGAVPLMSSGKSPKNLLNVRDHVGLKDPRFRKVQIHTEVVSFSPLFRHDLTSVDLVEVVEKFCHL